MIGRQVSFYMFGEDENSFLSFLIEKKKAIPIRSITPKAEVVTLEVPLPSPNSDVDAWKVLIWNNNYPFPAGVFQLLPDRKWDEQSENYISTGIVKYRIDDEIAPVIEFSRSCQNRDGVLVKGRLWVAVNVAREYLSVAEHEGFKTWCDAILRWVRRAGKRIEGQDGYFFPMAAEAFRSKIVQFAP
jgi:hypothetical protein